MKGPGTTPVGTPLRLRLWAKRLSGGTSYALGKSSSGIELTDDWEEHTITITSPTMKEVTIRRIREDVSSGI